MSHIFNPWPGAVITEDSSISCIATRLAVVLPAPCCAAIVLPSCCAVAIIAMLSLSSAVQPPFGASDALAPMNSCATVRPVSLLARSPREPRLFAPRASSRAHLANLEWLHSTCLLAPCLPGCSHRATNSGASGLSATTSATLTVITSHHHIVTPNHLRV